MATDFICYNREYANSMVIAVVRGVLVLLLFLCHPCICEVKIFDDSETLIVHELQRVLSSISLEAPDVILRSEMMNNFVTCFNTNGRYEVFSGIFLFDALIQTDFYRALYKRSKDCQTIKIYKITSQAYTMAVVLVFWRLKTSSSKSWIVSATSRLPKSLAPTNTTKIS